MKGTGTDEWRIFFITGLQTNHGKEKKSSYKQVFGPVKISSGELLQHQRKCARSIIKSGGRGITKCGRIINNKSYYFLKIRKRKLEKADILELTVNHLRNLQKVQTCKWHTERAVANFTTILRATFTLCNMMSHLIISVSSRHRLRVRTPKCPQRFPPLFVKRQSVPARGRQFKRERARDVVAALPQIVALSGRRGGLQHHGQLPRASWSGERNAATCSPEVEFCGRTDVQIRSAHVKRRSTARHKEKREPVQTHWTTLPKNLQPQELGLRRSRQNGLKYSEPKHVAALVVLWYILLYPDVTIQCYQLHCIYIFKMCMFNVLFS